MGASSASLFKDGDLLFAIEEERLSRIKNDGGFPILAIQECLNHASISIDDIEAVCVYWKPLKITTRIRGVLSKLLSLDTFSISIIQTTLHSLFSKENKLYPELRGRWLDLFFIRSIIKKNFKRYNGKIYFFDHHLTHQYYAEAIDNYCKSISLSFDGGGEEDSTVLSINENNKKKIIKKIKWPNSMGHYYSYFTGFLGFRMLEGEYKMMGLAPLGTPKYKKEIYDNIISFDEKNGIYNFNFRLCDYHSALKGRFNKKIIKIFGNPRKSNDPVTQVHMDIAASVQIVFEEILIDLLKFIKKSDFNSENLVLSGGCALNVTANGKIIEKKMFSNVTLPPAPHDGGCSIGAVLAHLKINKNISINYESIKNPYLGSSFTSNEMLQVFKEKNLSIPNFYNDEDLTDIVAKKLSNQEIIAWFQGRSEFGPRALGSRSFLADPRNDEIREEINRKIKKRELFRPFAPSVIFEKQNEFFEMDKFSPYMNIVSKVKENKKNIIPAVVHTDGTSRVHSVKKDYNSLYYLLLSKFYQKTGVPILLNTSFNIQEPIVNSPADAIRTFFNSDVDTLVLGNYLCDLNWKKKQKYE